MPKLIEETEDAVDPESIEKAAARKLLAALDDDDGELLVYMRIENNRIEYSIINRPDPTMSGVNDAVLMSAILRAGRSYDFKRQGKLAQKDRVKAMRGDTSGSEIVYKDRVIIDFNKETMTSTRKRDLTLSALSIVVQNLAQNVTKAEAAKVPSKPN